jgi:hypothetical protein
MVSKTRGQRSNSDSCIGHHDLAKLIDSSPYRRPHFRSLELQFQRIAVVLASEEQRTLVFLAFFPGNFSLSDELML